jgi:iron(III) transport system permease protein
VALPLGAVFLTSVQKSFGAGMALDNLTVSHWGEVLTNPRTLRAARWSLTLALGAAALVCALGVAAAILRRRPGLVGRAVETLALWPYAIPGTVFSMALIVAFSRDLRFIAFERVAFVLALGDTFWLLLVAYTAKYLALGTRNTTEALAQLDPSLEEAARISGAGPARAFRDAMLPLLRPALVTAFALVFLTAATELTMSVMLLPAGRDLLGTLLFELTTYADPAAAAVLACAFVLLVMSGLGVVALARRPAREAA